MFRRVKDPVFKASCEIYKICQRDFLASCIQHQSMIALRLTSPVQKKPADPLSEKYTNSPITSGATSITCRGGRWNFHAVASDMFAKSIPGTWDEANRILVNMVCDPSCIKDVDPCHVATSPESLMNNWYHYIVHSSSSRHHALFPRVDQAIGNTALMNKLNLAHVPG